MGISNRIFLLALKVCAQCGQTGRNADKIPRHTSKVNYVRMGLHCALQSSPRIYSNDNYIYIIHSCCQNQHIAYVHTVSHGCCCNHSSVSTLKLQPFLHTCCVNIFVLLYNIFITFSSKGITDKNRG